MALINIYHLLNLRVEHGGLYRDLLETSMSKVISPSTKGFSWEGEETPAVYRSLYDRGEETPPLGLR